MEQQPSLHVTTNEDNPCSLSPSSRIRMAEKELCAIKKRHWEMENANVHAPAAVVEDEEIGRRQDELRKSAALDGKKLMHKLQTQLQLNQMSHSEKDALIDQLEGQVEAYREKVDDVADFGENLAISLVLHQNEREECYCMYREEMEQRLFAATYHHPEVQKLQADLERCWKQNRMDKDQLRFAVLKLKRNITNSQKVPNPSISELQKW